MSVNHSTKSGSIIGISFWFFLIIKVCFVFSLKLPHWGDSNEYTQYTIFNIKKKITLNYPKSAAIWFFQRTEEWAWSNCGKQALSVWATDGLLYLVQPGHVAQSVGHLTHKSGVLESIPGLATYFRFSFRFFKKGSCQLLAKVCARSTG